MVSRYQKRVSGPILDRIDIHIDVPSVDTQKLINEQKTKSEASAQIQARVQKARDIQLKRFKGTNLKSNSEMSTRDVKKFCELDDGSRSIMTSAVAQMGITARSYFKVVKTARTIADLAGDKNISSIHIAEALQYRPKNED
jgi:magnesium chelatase family protein